MLPPVYGISRKLVQSLPGRLNALRASPNPLNAARGVEGFPVGAPRRRVRAGNGGGPVCLSPGSGAEEGRSQVDESEVKKSAKSVRTTKTLTWSTAAARIAFVNLLVRTMG